MGENKVRKTLRDFCLLQTLRIQQHLKKKVLLGPILLDTGFPIRKQNSLFWYHLVGYFGSGNYITFYEIFFFFWGFWATPGSAPGLL